MWNVVHKISETLLITFKWKKWKIWMQPRRRKTETGKIQYIFTGTIRYFIYFLSSYSNVEQYSIYINIMPKRYLFSSSSLYKIPIWISLNHTINEKSLLFMDFFFWGGGLRNEIQIPYFLLHNLRVHFSDCTISWQS